MSCKKYFPLLSEYQEGALDQNLSEEIDKHLASCSTCRQELSALEKIEATARLLARHEPDADVVMKVKSAIYSAPKNTRRTEFGPVLDIEELADFLRVDKSTIGDYLEELPCFELGGKILFRRKSIEEWIAKKELNFGSQMLSSRLKERAGFREIKGEKIWTI